MSPSRTVHIRILAGLILSLFSHQMTKGQITSSTADRLDSVAYETPTAKDPLFVFHQLNQVFKPGSLTATLPGSEVYNFEWSKYNPGINGFDPPFSTDTDEMFSTASDLEDGGYQVRIWDGAATDTVMTAWVMLDQFYAEVEKNLDDILPSYKFTCDFLVLSGFVTPDTVNYYDLISHNPIQRISDYKFKWTSDNDEIRIPNDTIILDPNITFQPPYEDTWYILTAIDEFGMTEVDSVYYESIQTKAEFTVEYYDKVTGEFDSELTGEWSNPTNENPVGSTDAMLTVRFVNKSRNGAQFDWVFLDTIGGIKQSEITYDTAQRTEYTYERAHEYYYPHMVSTSDAGCVDSFMLDEPIYVEPSQLDIPNVFTPNGDGNNDVFIFKHQSLEKCQIAIADRGGKIVYKKKIENIYDWEGWNGKLHDSDREAPEGQYYFVVEAMGYDGIEYRDSYFYEKWKIFGGTGNKDPGSGSGGTDPNAPEGTTGTRYTGWLYLYRHTGTY